MSESVFAFLRGSAAVMAADLATTPTTGIEVQSCGDAHLLNFGLFASPERTLLFDINDFDETSPAPWEWDVKRLAASATVAARGNGWDDDVARGAAASAVAGYRTVTTQLATMGSLDVFYAKVDADKGSTLTEDPASRKVAKKAVARAHKRTSARAMAKLTVADAAGRPRIVEQPPLIVHPPPTDNAEEVLDFIKQYWQSVRADVRRLLTRFEVVDVARKVVGVGSVGTRCYVVLLRDALGTPLFLQVKEAEASVLEQHWPASEEQTPGRRVVEGQQVMQAASDVFLGWGSGAANSSYVRQLKDMKGSVEVERLSPTMFTEYSALCGWALARAHAQSGKAADVSAYLGSSTKFDDAIADFALAYSRQVEDDYAHLLAAIEDGRVEAQRGV
jgi:uncharacterized protein (DUF2252 family)